MAPSAMKTNVDPCPDLETIAAYLDGRLAEAERAAVSAHLAQCESCYFVFSEAAQMRAADSGRHGGEAQAAASARAGRWFSPRVLWPSAAVLAAAASLVIAIATGSLSPQDSYSTELTTLVSAVGAERPVEGRLTGGFAHGAVRGTVRGADANTISPDVRIAAADIERKVLGKTTVRARHLLGLAYLTSGDVGRAVAALEQAAEEESASAQVLSDLAAAYLARATQTGQPQDLAKALAAADRAVKAQPDLPEALFNRAYVLERLSLTSESRQAWEEYLRVDTDSPWAEEARSHLRDLP